jgi:hypothetical protein
MKPQLQKRLVQFSALIVGGEKNLKPCFASDTFTHKWLDKLLAALTMEKHRQQNQKGFYS